MNRARYFATSCSLLLAVSAAASADADSAHPPASLFERRAIMESASTDAGPQSPRDIDQRSGNNRQIFGPAPARQQMNLCNIHLHEGAEHRGGQFTTFIGPGNGLGMGSGFRYDGTLTPSERAPFERAVGKTTEGDLSPGDTVEIHFVFSTSAVAPGPGLGACTSAKIMNPQLRGEAVIAVLVNDPNAAKLTHVAAIMQINGYYQIPNLPDDLGNAVTYSGSTTGPDYDLAPSFMQITWNVRPRVLKLDIGSVEAWLRDNPFKETHAHGVRDLIVDPDLLAPIP
jgi:hypothetical protein